MTTATAESKTKALGRQFLHTSLLDGNPLNPNSMSDQEFNLLYDNIEQMGVTDPILVRPTDNGRYRIVGGHHRVEVAKLVGLTDLPCTIITDPEFDDDQEAFQAVRHNMIRGSMSAEKFMKLYQSLSGKYEDEVAAQMFGFTSEEDFKRMVKETGKSLPKDMQQAFKDATKEIKTINDLALVLNKLFTAHGDTLPYGFMVFDFGGQEHIWVRMAKGQKLNFMVLAEYCTAHQRSVDQVLAVVMQLIAEQKLDQVSLDAKVALLSPVVFSKGQLPVEQPGG